MSAIVHQAAISLPSNDVTILVASLVVLVVILATFSASRIWPARRPVASPEQAAYLMDQLVTEKETARQLRTELDATKVEITTLRSEVSQLRTENASLRTQMEYVLSLMRGQATAQASTAAATQPAKPGSRSQQATAHMTDDDVAFRDWLIRHFDAEELDVLTADCGIEKQPAGPITSKATSLVQLARRTGMTEILEQAAMDRRPSVGAW